MIVTINQLINYYVDVQGYSEQEAHSIATIYGTTCLDESELIECIEFNQ